MVSPSLARDAEAPCCLQRGRNSCGSMGSAQRDMLLALSRGLCCPAAPLLSVNSWSLLMASREKDSPFSWKEKADVGVKKLQLDLPKAQFADSNIGKYKVCGSNPQEYRTLV